MANWIRINNAGYGYVAGSNSYFTFTKAGEIVDINLDTCSRIIHANDHVYIFQGEWLVVSCTEADYCNAVTNTISEFPYTCEPPKIKIVEAAAMRQ